MRYLILLVILISSQLRVYSQCASFSIISNTNSLCSPGIVRYEVLNTPSGSTYEWNVGLGQTTGADTLFAFYNSAMLVNATVKVTLPNGLVCTVSEDSLVTIRDIPQPQFLASSYKLCHGPDIVTFYDITPNSASRNWIIDGTNYNQTTDSINHQFVTSGFKKVSLVVVDSFGCEGVAQFADTIKVYPNLVFDYSSSQVSGCAPKTVDFELTSNPNSLYQKTFSWHFPGSNSEFDSGTSPASRVYSTSGSYTTSLRVDLSIGCTYITEKQSDINLGDSFPLRVRVQNAIGCGESPVYVELLNDSLPTFADWLYIGIDHTVKSISGTKKEIYIADSGILNIYITHDFNGCISRRTISRNMYRMNVKADFYSDDNYHCDTPHTVHLWNNSDTMDANTLSYVWNIYKDGSLVHTSTGEHDSLTFYELPAYHTVELIATGDNGCADTIVRKDFIYQDSLWIKFIPIPKIACVGQAVLFNNSTKPSSYLATDQFIWTFYDLDDSTVLDTSHEVSPTMVYYDTGYYDVYVTAKNGIGCRDTVLEEDRVLIIEPQLEYVVNNPVICRGDSFHLVSSSKPDIVNFDHKWTFINQISQNEYEFEGQDAYAYIDEAGPFTLIYESSIKEGCYRYDTTVVHINDLNLNVIIESTQDCSPFSLQPQVEVIDNYHYPLSDTSVSINWYVSPSNGETIDPQDSFSPFITLYNDGYYQIAFEAINSSFCVDSFLSDSLQVGVTSEFTVNRPNICLGDTLQIELDNFRANTSVEFSVTDYSNYNLIQYDSTHYGLVPYDSGSYELNVIVSRDSSCFDTSNLDFKAIKVIADFTSNDTFLQCAPVYVQFESLSINADSLFWDFGDGGANTTTSASAATIYEKNTGSTDGYDIQLIAKNSAGCYDTAFKLDYIIVKGPIPKFTIENNIGCEPLEVTFLDSSIDVARFFLNYNDGSELDSSSIDTHTYYNRSNLLIQKIRPSIFVYDSLGCGAVYESPKSVTVYKQPKAEFDLETDSGQCQPMKAVFTDISQYVLYSEWHLDDTVYSYKAKDSALFYTPGFNQVKLITTNLYNCTDTAVQEVFVSGFPQVNLTIHDTLCYQKDVNFSVELTLDENTDTTDMKFFWDFGEPGSLGNKQIGIEDKVFSYNLTGPKQIKLYVELANQCTDSFIKMVDIMDEDDIDTPSIQFVTFDENYQLRIVHESTNYVRFRTYNLQATDGLQIVESNVDDTVQIVDFISKPVIPICYDLFLSDVCDLNGYRSQEHCFIYLDVQSVVPFENILNWTAYKGWPSVDSYKIFRRSTSDTNVVQIATVDGETLVYKDTNLCLDDYQYYVQAIHPSKPFYSNSFKVNQRPLYAENPLLSSVKNVSVSAENQISVKWNKSSHSRWDYYVLKKYENDETRFLDSFIVRDTFLIDNEVQTSEHSYIYKLHEVDICGEQNQSDREGKSILLSGYFDEGSHLSWTAYRKWLNGVSFYDMEFVNPGHVQLLSTIDASTTYYLDDEYHPYVYGPYCYRVYGVNDIADTSYSNVVCVHGDPLVYIPNAFSPNNDGHNEVFRPITTFITEGNEINLDNYLFVIYNRWGEKVFETFDIEDAWDGTFQSQDCQQDVYIYRLQCEGVDGLQYNYNGTVTLLR